MAARMTLVYVTIIILYDVVANEDQLINATDIEINDTIYNSTSEMNETEVILNEIYSYNITEVVNEILLTTTDLKNEKMCNKTVQDSKPNSVDTNSSVLSNFSDEFLIDEIDGVSLNDIVTTDCGGTKVCPHLNWTANDTITIGFFGAYARSKTVLGALPLAVAAINREPILLPGLKLRFVAADIGRSRPSLPMEKDSLSLRVMTQMRDLGVVAFFGPDDTCHTEAKLAAAWNLPLISHKCSGARGPSQEAGAGLGATFARTLPPAYKISKSVVALLKAFGWTKFAIIVGDELTAAAQQMDAIKELAQSEGMTVTVEHRFADYLPKHISDMEQIVDQTYDKTRGKS